MGYTVIPIPITSAACPTPARTLRIDRDGAVTVETDGRTLWVTTAASHGP